MKIMTYRGIQNMFCIWSEKIFLRVRARFVECRDALMQILVSLDRDKNISVGVTGALVASEKRLTVGLCFVKKTTNWACEWGETYGRTLFFFFCWSRRLPIGLVSERRITVGLVLFSFYYFDDQLDLPVKETDSTIASEISACGKKEASLKKKIFLLHEYCTWCLFSWFIPFRFIMQK